MIITLCGSARFEPWFDVWNKALSLAGHMVFGWAGRPPLDDEYSSEDRTVLDVTQKNKILSSQAVLFLNCFAYLGESALSELEFASNLRTIRIYMLESWGKGCGIGPSHYDSVRDAARRYQIPEGYTSPIDACLGMVSGRRTYYYPFDLLGPAGARRTRLVKMIHAVNCREGGKS